MREFMKRYLACTVLLFSFFKSFQAQANAVGVGVQNFHPTYSGLDFVSVHSSNTLEEGYFNIGAFINYSENTLPYFDDEAEDDQSWSSQIHIGLGLTKNWDIGYSMPMLNSQDVGSNQAVGFFEKTGVSEHRIQSKYRFLRGTDWGAAFIGGLTFDNTENYPLSGNDPGPTWTLELALDKQITEKIRLAFNAGYKLRDEGDAIAAFTTVSPLKDQWIFSAAANYAFLDYNSVIITEAYASIPAEESDVNTNKEITSAELLLGYKYVGFKNFDLHAGAGTEILQGTSTPDWRVYAGFNWRIGPLWNKPQESNQKVIEEVEQEETIDITEYKEYKEIPVKKKANYVIRNINFETASDKLTPDSKASLDKFAEFLKAPPGIISLAVHGHTDSQGSDTYNLNLSQRRANAVKTYLSSKGLEGSKISATGFGESKPIDTNETADGRAKNRRVEFKVER